MLSIIVAMDEQGVIGYKNTIPWRLAADMKHVKETTMGKPIVMGRKTHQSIGKPLPGRENIVITRDVTFRSDGCRIFHSLDEALSHYAGSEEVMILGGAELYKLTLEQAGRIYLTEVHTKVEGDTYFPAFEQEQWREISRERHGKDDKNEFDYSFVILER